MKGKWLLWIYWKNFGGFNFGGGKTNHQDDNFNSMSTFLTIGNSNVYPSGAMHQWNLLYYHTAQHKTLTRENFGGFGG